MTPAALPVPALADTLEQVLRSASAILTPEKLAELTRLSDAFSAGPGPELQQRLEAYAAKQDAAGSNWMAPTWTRLYLENREPLQTSTNVGFQLTVPDRWSAADRNPVDRIVNLIRRAAVMHLQEAAGATEPEVGFRDTPVSMEQWRCFNGGLRVPRPQCDTWEAASPGRSNRRIGLLAHGRMWSVPLTDADGQLVPAAALRTALERARASDAAEFGFAELSALGSEVLADVLAEIDSPHNRAVLDELRKMLFMVSIVDPAEIPASASDVDLLRVLTFHPGTVWAYKPITYQVGLTHPLVLLHAEHSMIDGATIAEAWRRIQAEGIDSSGAESSAPPTSHASKVAEPSELTWDLTPAHITRVDSLLRRPRALADQIHARCVHIPRPLDEEQPFRSSADARAQLIAQCAQQLTNGQIRGVYEAVDMREYQAGRTEALRSVTPESVEFAIALANGCATRDLFGAALAAHRDWVKRTKQGAGCDRHLLMLTQMQLSSSSGRVPEGSLQEDAAPISSIPDDSISPADPFLSSPLLAQAREDFLSTSSLGSADQIGRFVYAPTAQGGYGLNYTMHPDRGEYLVTWRAGEAVNPHEFITNLQRAGEDFWAFIGALPSCRD